MDYCSSKITECVTNMGQMVTLYFICLYHIKQKLHRENHGRMLRFGITQPQTSGYSSATEENGNLDYAMD